MTPRPGEDAGPGSPATLVVHGSFETLSAAWQDPLEPCSGQSPGGHAALPVRTTSTGAAEVKFWDGEGLRPRSMKTPGRFGLDEVVRGPGLRLQTQEVFSACSAGWFYKDQGKGWRAKSLPTRWKRPHGGLAAFRYQEMPTCLVPSLPPGSGPARGPPSPVPAWEGPRPGDPRGPEGTLPHSTQARTVDGLTRDNVSAPSTEPPCPPDPPSEA